MSDGQGVSLKKVMMTRNLITRTLTFAKALIEDSNISGGRGNGRGNKHTKIGKGSSYVLRVVQRVSPITGMLCRKCDKFIMPGQECYSKQGNNDHTIRTYYHIDCVERLYH